MRAGLVCSAILDLLPLQAEAPRIGAHLAWVAPQSDFRDLIEAKRGFAGGLHVTFDLGNDLQVRPHLTQAVFGDGHFTQAYVRSGVDYRDSQTQQVEQLQVGLDLLVFGKRGTRSGPYFLLGLSQDAWKLSTQYRLETLTGPATGASGGTRVQTGNQVGAITGVGWRYDRRWSGELRYEWSSFGNNAFGMDSLRLQVGMRF